ncbi:MAG: hypothetical protein H0T89_09090 [Deltaproteobacteria bacterium]|nr:hypothetical protein [Deltaproteobacteria bacterium]MDQ3295992.1 hypothetical protein [Myxococcota bacterium]
MRHLVLLACLTACDLYVGSGDTPPDPPTDPDPPDPAAATFRLVLDDSMAGERTINGIDSDGAGGLWILYRDPTAGYDDLATLHVVHLDAQRAKLSEWVLEDEYAWTSGIAYTGDAVWINYSGVDQKFLRKLDPITGATLGTFAMTGAITDISAGGSDELLLSVAHNQVIAIDRTTGGQTTQTAVAAPFTSSTQRGIVRVAGRSWVASWTTDDIYVVDDAGTITDIGTTDVRPGHVAAENIYLAWDGTRLVMSARNQIYWLAIDPL